jgi:hypothetical protein
MRFLIIRVQIISIFVIILQFLFHLHFYQQILRIFVRNEYFSIDKLRHEFIINFKIIQSLLNECFNSCLINVFVVQFNCFKFRTIFDEMIYP